MQTPEYLIAYGCIEGCRTVMVLKVPLEETITAAAALKERMRTGTQRLLERNGMVLWAIAVIVNILALFMSRKMTAHIRGLAEAADRLAAAKSIVTYCDGENCDLSHELALFLIEMGFENVRVLVNGWTVWQQAGLPTDGGN